MEEAKAILALIKSTAKKYIPDAEVNLFGSRARYNASPDSDYDILIITEKELTPGEKLPLKLLSERNCWFTISGQMF